MKSRKVRNLARITLTPLPGLTVTVQAAVSIANLRCEYLTDPLGIDVTQPRLSWVLESAERGEERNLRGAGRADVWTLAGNGCVADAVELDVPAYLLHVNPYPGSGRAKPGHHV